jgi:type I restriction enzyme R subunit
VTPEEKARILIDQQLVRAGWVVSNRDEVDLVNNRGVAVREVIMDAGHGRADYLLYLDRRIIGVIEAKPEGTTLSGIEWQSGMYAEGLPADLQPQAVLVADRLPFIFEASGSETHFTNGYDPRPRARSIFNFPRPETLDRILRFASKDPQKATWRAQVQEMPPYDGYDLRPASKVAVGAIEEALRKQQYSRSLVQMATGAGKTRMAVTECYRLLHDGGFNRILFLVDRNNLGDQTLREFRDYETPDDGRKFTELYNVEKLTRAGVIDSSKVVISTIQRVFSILKGDEVADEDDPGIDGYVPDAPVTVEYSAELPPETFDLVIIDECHRSIYGVWRSVLEYFDAHLLGLTATPTKQTFGFFQQNMVSEYTYAQSVADGVNVDFDVFRIETEVTAKGGTIEAGAVVPKMDRRTRQQRLESVDDEIDYTPNELDRAVTNRNQIRLVLDTFRANLPVMFPDRVKDGNVSVCPKTLIFAKDDNHAEEIVGIVREVFGQGNDFAAKITYTAKDPKALLQKFRNSPTLRIAVTVDMIATGTDVRAIECVFFMRDVKSRTYFEQMKGRGARTINPADFQALTPDAKTKDRFVIVDAVGVTEHPFVDAAPLERTKTIPLKKLLERAGNFSITEDEVTTLGSRLARLGTLLTTPEHQEIKQLADEPLTAIAGRLLTLADPDVLAEIKERAEQDPDGPSPDQALEDYIHEVVTPLAGNAPLRQRLLEMRAVHDLYFDEETKDILLKAAPVIDPEKAQEVITNWKQYIEDNKDEITLIQVLYSQPKGPKLTFAEITEMANKIQAPPRSWSIGLLWNAYEALDATHVKKSPRHTATDLVTLIRYTLGLDEDLTPYAQVIEARYQNWLAQQAQAGVEFSDDQRWWLDRIKDTFIQSAEFKMEDLEMAPFTERGGIDGVGRDLGQQAQALVDGLSEALAA